MADAKIIELLSQCPSPETGCYASDPDALEMMISFSGDSAIHADLVRASVAATDAAENGIPLEEATYRPVIIEVAGLYTYLDPGGQKVEAEHHRLGAAEPKRIIEEASTADSISELRERIARCAHACGATAVGCPVRTPLQEA